MLIEKFASRIGVIAMWKTEGLQIEVRILDTRPSFGRVDYLITPIAGQGEKWVQAMHLHFAERG